jgi:hypothetical protein
VANDKIVAEKTAFAPGPWKSAGLIIYAADGSPVASLLASHRAVEEWYANAPLIAAAPELLASTKELRAALAAAMRVISNEACVDQATDAFIAELAHLGIPDGIGVRADAAIARAEGKS